MKYEMTTKLQNKAWSLLPKEFKEEVKAEYHRTSIMYVKGQYELGVLHTYENTFGHHNLTSDAEDEESGGECLLFPSRDQRDWSKWTKPGPWEPKQGETFCYVNALLRPLLNRHDGTDYDRDLIESGNCFRTEEEAREAAGEIRKCLKDFHDRKAPKGGRG